METKEVPASAYGESNSNCQLHDEISDSKLDTTSTEPPTLDDLVALVGELVIASATANLLARKAGRPELAEANSTVSLLVERIRDTTLQMRMERIGDTFAALSDAAEVIAKEQSKQVEVGIRGGNADVDKSVIARISEPLLALVRHTLVNAIELPDLRVGLGKPPAGRIELNAYHDSASIVIEVSDDGAGLDVSGILGDTMQTGRDVERQLSARDEPSGPTHEVESFSGAEHLIEIRRAFEELKGSVRVTCELGKGSRYVVRLPLTLAIVDGFLTAVGKSSFVLPLDAVVECLELPVNHTDRDYLNLRGEVLPFIRLRDLFQVSGERPARENVIVVSHMGQHTGVVVDQLLGELQTVIKPLGSLFSHMRGIGGSTILGSGEVALILDVASLTKLSAGLERQQIGYSPQVTARMADAVAT